MSMIPHYKALLRLGLPIVIGQMGLIVLGLADTLMIGHHSTDELAAAGFVNNVFNLAIIFTTGFSYGLTPIVGRLFGQGKRQEAARALKNSLAANTLIALLVGGVLSWVYLYLGQLGQPEELLPTIRPYYLLQLLSIPFIAWFGGFKQFTDGITDTQVSMWIMLGGNLMNIVGNYLLIYGQAGCPELGLTGAGIATLLSRITMVAVYLLLFFGSRRYTHYRHGFRWGRINLQDFVELNRLGWPLAGQMGMETAAFSLSAVMVGWLGSNELATNQIMIAVSQICFMMYYGMGAAVSVRISNFCGTSDWKNVRTTAHAGFHLILFMAVMCSIPIFLLRHAIGGWFTDNEAVSGMVVQVILPFLIYQFGDGLQINFANALRGIADVRPMLLFAFLAYFVISLPLSYVFAFVCQWGLTGIWMAYPFGLTSAGLMYYFRFRQSLHSHLLRWMA